MPNLPINAARLGPQADDNLKERFFRWDERYADFGGEGEEVVPMDSPLDFKPENQDVANNPLPPMNISETREEPLDLSEPQPETPTDPFDQPIDLSPDVESIYKDTKYAELKAEKFDFALGEDSPGFENLRAQLELGEDRHLREAMAAKVSLEREQTKVQAIREQLAKDTPLTPEEVQDVFFTSKVNTQADPATVLEELYGDRYVNTVANLPNAGEVIKATAEEMPEQTLDSLDGIADEVAKHEIISDLRKDHEKRWSDKSTFGVIGEYAETFIPLKSYSNLSNAAEEAPREQVGSRGENRRAIYEYYRTLSPSQFKKEFTAAYQRIAESNLLDAEAFIDGYLNYAPSDAVLDDIFGYLDWAGVGGLVFGGAKAVQVLGNKGIARAMRPRTVPNAPSAPDPFANVQVKPDETVSVVPTDEPAVTVKTEGNTISVNSEKVKAQWEKKPWRTPKRKGVNPLPDDEFLLPEDWERFVVERQKVAKFLDKKNFANANDYDNFLNNLTLSTVKSAQRNAEAKQVLKDTVKAATHEKIEDQLAQVGEVDLSAAALAHKRIKERFDKKDPFADSLDLQNRTVSLFFPHEHGRNPGSLSRKQAEAITARAYQSAEKLLRSVTDDANIVRTTPEATQAAIDAAKAQMVRQFDRLSDAVLDVDLGGPFRVYTPEEQVPNVFTLEYRLGRITKKEKPKAPPPPKATPATQKPKAEPPKLPDPTGDAYLDVVNKHTALNGKVLVRDLYDRMKSEGTFTGSLADFRQLVTKWYNEKKITASRHEQPLPKQAPVKPPKKLTPTTDLKKAIGPRPDTGGRDIEKWWDHKSRVLAKHYGVKDAVDEGNLAYIPENKLNDAEYIKEFLAVSKVIDKVADDVTRVAFKRLWPDAPSDIDKNFEGLAAQEAEFGRNFRQYAKEIGNGFEGAVQSALREGYYNEAFLKATIKTIVDELDSFLVKPKGAGIDIAKAFNLSTIRSKHKAATNENLPKEFQDVIGRIDAEKKNLDYIKAPTSTAELEEGNFASEFRRDLGYGNETYRNRIIDSEVVYKKETKYTSARRFHYIEPPAGFPVKKDAPKPTVPKGVSYPKAEPKNISEATDALVDLLQKLGRTDNTALKLRISRALHSIEKKVTTRGLGDDVRGLDETMNTSPYQDKYTSVTRRKVKKGEKEIEQIEVSDVDRRVARDRFLSPTEKNNFRKLEKEVHEYLATVQPRKRSAPEEPYIVETKLGKPSATLFDNQKQAAHYGVNLYGLSPNQFKILPMGNKYYISIPKVVDETVPLARDLMTATNNISDSGFTNAFIGMVRTPDEFLSSMHNANRKLAAYAPSEMHKLMQEAATEIRKMPRQERDELVEIWIANRDHIVEDPDTGKIERGQFYRSFADFERGFRARFDKLPTEAQTAAYFEYVRLYDYDYVLRNLALHRDLGRLGLEKTRLFTHVDNDGQIDSFPSRWFSSRTVDELPLSDSTGEDWGVFVYDDQARSGKFYLRSQLTQDVLDDISSKTKDHGYKVLELGNPLEKPLRQIANTDENVNFLIVKNAEKVKYDWGVLPYRPGGHIEYGDKFFTKQPRIRRSDAAGFLRNIYEGDTALLNHSSEAEAKQFAQAADTARLMLRDGASDAELEDFLSGNLPFSLKEWKAFFKERQTPKGDIIPPKFHIDDPFTYTFSGRNTFDMEHYKSIKDKYENFVDGIRSKYNIFANGVDKKYLGQRDPDLPAAGITGENTPAMVLAKPRLIDPLDTINSSLANVIRSKYLNDYKHYAVESFIQEFRDVMKQVPIEHLRRDPVYYLHNPVWDTELTGDGFYKLQAAKNARRAILNFLGTDSPLAENMYWLQQKAVNSIYKNFGQDAANYVVSKKLLPFEKDPITYARSIAFHENLGLWNIKQLFLQAQSWVNVAGIEGMGPAIRAIPKAYAARSVTYKGGDPEFVRGFAKQLGLDGDDFVEAYEELRKTGFDNVGGEYASRDDYFDPKVIQGPVGTFLEKGTFFFREGERFSRLSAWFVSYDKWRAANPGKRMTNADRLNVLNRADLLTANMSRASNAHLMHGLGSIPTQYYAYQTRLSELMLGKRLRRNEKLRLFATYSAMYGVPVGLSSALIYPFYDDFRQAALERGINMDNKAIQLFHDGLISTATSVITGEQYDISQRLGPAGLSVFKDIKALLGFGETDKTLLDILIGASGQTLKDNAKALGTAFEFIASAFTVDQDGPTLADFSDVTKNISSVNTQLRAWYMYNTGRYFTQKEGVVTDDLTGFDAFMHSMLGTTPNEVGDTFRMIESRKEQKKAEDYAKKQVVKYLRQSARYRQEGDTKNSVLALRKAKAELIAGGIRPDQYSQIIKDAAKGHESMFDYIQKDFIQNAPLDQKERRMNEALDHARRNSN